jgi:hypothetical protein
MKIKTGELIDAPLDWAAAKCAGVPLVLAPFRGARNFVILGQNMKPTSATYAPSTSWSQGGPIIEHEAIELVPDGNGGWRAAIRGGDEDDVAQGPTPLIAAMRCFVASRLGDEVDIPAELSN